MTFILPIILIILLLIFGITTINKHGGVSIKRIESEIKIARKNGTELVWNKDNPHYMCVKYNDGMTYNIDIPDDYPFKQVSVNGWKVFSDDQIGKPIVDSISEFKKPNKILIYCHPEPLSLHAPDKDKIPTSNRDNLQHHWFNNVIYEQAINAGIDDPINALVLCVDTREQADYIISKTNASSVTKIKYQKGRVKEVDGFSDEFIADNTDMFRTIAVPDCDGSWWKDNNISSWVEKIKRVATMLKSGGTLVVSKFAGSDSKQWNMPKETSLTATEKKLAEQIAGTLRKTDIFEYVNVRSFKHIMEFTPLHAVEYVIWYVEMKKIYNIAVILDD